MDYDIVALCVLAVFIPVFVYLTYNYNYWSLKKIVHVPAITAVFGNLIAVFKQEENFSGLCYRLYKSAPESSMYGFYFMRTPALLVREPQLVKTVLQTKWSSFSTFVRPHDKCDPLLANTPFFSSEISSWMVNIFTNDRLNVAFTLLRKFCTELNVHLDRKIDDNRNGVVELELITEMSKLAGEIVGNIGLGTKINSSESEFVASSLKKIFKPGKMNGLRQFVCLLVPKLARVLHLKLVSSSTDHLLRETAGKILNNRRKNGPTPNDVLHWLVDEADNTNMDQDKVTGHLFTFLFESYEVISLIGSFMFFYIAWNPEIQKRARKDINEIIKKHGGELTYEALRDMKYLEQIINETMRLHPVFGAISKICNKAVEFVGSDGQSCTLKPGDLVFVSSQGVHMDETLWPNPTVFDPERFSPVNKKKRCKFDFLPFENPKYCVALEFNTIVLKMMLATILRNYQLNASAKTKIPVKLSTKTFVSTVDNGLWVTYGRSRNSTKLH